MFLASMRRKARATRVDGEAGWMMGRWRAQRRVRTAWTLDRKKEGNLGQLLMAENLDEEEQNTTRAGHEFRKRGSGESGEP